MSVILISNNAISLRFVVYCETLGNEIIQRQSATSSIFKCQRKVWQVDFPISLPERCRPSLICGSRAKRELRHSKDGGWRRRIYGYPNIENSL